jgi:hypothetical protein
LRFQHQQSLSCQHVLSAILSNLDSNDQAPIQFGRIQGMASAVERYADAVCQVLDGARGNWQDGAYYTGGYEVVFASVKHGGRNFLQSAKISFDVEVSK